MEFGVGYSNNGSESVGGDEWIEDLGVLYYKESNSVNIDFIQKFSFNKYLDFIRNGQENIEIKEKDLLNYSNELKNMFPHSMYLYGEFLKLNNEFDDENFSFVFKGFGGPSGANLLGRFTYGDTKLEGLTNNIIEDEENASPDVLFAEIVHLPEDRLGNVLLRPVLRKFEIPYLGKSGNEFKNQILVEDLMVSIKNNEIILRSKRLNKRIIPRLTTAHNFNSFNNLPIYKFLCELQFQNYASPIIWDWGILNSQKYLPRVFYKNIIIKKAVWKINIVDFKDELSESLFSSNYIASKLNTIGIPKIFTIVQGDNKLLVNIDIEDNIILFKNILERNKNIIIEEFLFNEDNCIVHDIEGRPYVNEVIIPFKNKVNAIHSYAFNDNIINESERKFAPGDGWLYFKIYCGSKIAEEILNEVLYEFITQSSENNLFDLFFFIRYKDPNPHLRLRFKSKNKKKLDKIKTEINKLIKPYLINGYIDSINLDTYVRELERYDDKLIFEAERIFHNDSLAVLHILKALKNDQTINNRIYCALIGVDTLLDNFGFSLYEKKLLLEKLSNRMLKRFGGHKKIRKIINDKYRSNQNVIFDLFQNKEKFKEFYRIMDLRSILNIEVIESLKNKIRKEEYSSKIENLISSYLHMFINRIFISQQLKYELLIYTFLERFYSSKFAVSNKEKIKK